MNFFLQDPNENRVPPEDVRLREVKVAVQSNGGRVKIFLELTPFMKRPNIDVTISDASGKEVAHTNILETMVPKLEFTMHLHEPEQGIEYRIETSVYYQRMPEPNDTQGNILLPDPMIVDRQIETFVFPKMEI